MNVADPIDAFFCKVVLNFLSDFSGSYSEYSLVQKLAKDSPLDGPWFEELRTSITEANEADKSMLGIGVIRSIISRGEVLDIVEQIYEANPSYREPVVPTETAKTLGELLDLSPLETLILDAACRFRELTYEMRLMFDNLDMRFKSIGDMYACMFGFPSRDGKKAAEGLLFNAGILSKDACAPDGFYGLNNDIEDVFSNKNLQTSDLDAAMFPHMLETTLALEDYPHLDKEIGRCIDIIEKNQKGKRQNGINLMFWGVPGTGKTELAVAMARERGWNLKVIGDVSANDLEENSRYNRITSLKLATKIYRNQPNTVLLFDEMEDLFKEDTNAQFSKAFINRIIETTNIPIIWTTNSLVALGQPVLRRMVYNIQFEVPPENVRAKVWAKYAEEYRVKIDEASIAKIAKTYPIAPALIKNAVHVTSTAFGRKKVNFADVTEIVGSLDTLVNYGKKTALKDDDARAAIYDVGFINADKEMVPFTASVLGAKKSNFAMCMYGPPGTGKSEYARYLAREMGKELLFKRASDLQSMWVGECEKNIAKAFAEAKEKNMVLLIDEGDSFLRDRLKARNSWEVTQVNEMLSQMERHSEPFILTTNLMNDLDAAALRRFTFKVNFTYMKTAQAREMFSRMFGKEAPRDLDLNTMLVPGDFKNVKDQTDILGITDPVVLCQMLHDETKLKPGHRNAIGIR